MWKEIRIRNRKSGHLYDVRYYNLQMCCDDSEKSERVFCVKHMSYSLNTRILNDFYVISRKFNTSEECKGNLTGLFFAQNFLRC
jgi:hypothetical protein